MKKILALLLVLLLAFSLPGCGDEQKAGKGELVLGKNAFAVNVTVRNMTNERVKFMVVPHADKFNYGGQGEIGKGIFGTDGLIPGKKKGSKVELDGSFTLYAHDQSGPSVVITVKGTYALDDLENNSATIANYYLYQDGQFTKSNKETVMKG